MHRRGFLVLTIWIAACSGGSGGMHPGAVIPGAAPSGQDPEFARFVDDYFAAKLAGEPSSATQIGIHDHDARLDDMSREAIERRLAELDRFLERLGRFDRAKLPLDDQIDAEAIEGEIQSDLLDGRVLRVWQRNPMAYVYLPAGSIDALIKRDFAPAAERLRSVISRLRQIPAVFAAARANLTEPPREYTDLAILMAKGSTGFFEGVLAPWAKTAAAGDDALLAELEAANATAIAESRAFAAWLEKDLLPRSIGAYAIGEDSFRAKLKWRERIETPLPELLARGEAQLEEDYAAFVATARQIDPAKTPAEVMRALSDTHPSRAELIPSVRRSIEEARQFVIDHKICTVPSDVRARVEETPAYARAGSFASMDTPGPFEARATEAFYYVTPVEPGWDAKHEEEHLRLFNPWVVAMINVHEAYPGHYLQFLWIKKLPTKTRQLVYAGSNAEGWAHYAEQMMVDQGFGGGDPRFRLAQLQEALVRDARYVVGIKLHTAGWTVAQGAKLFEDKAFQEPANAFEEARRGTYDPTYLIYSFGKHEIAALAVEYQKRTGASLQAFHDAFVSQGALPIPLVRRLLFR